MAVELDEGAGRLTVHGLLFRVCTEQIVELRNRLREPLWWEIAAKKELEICSWIEQPDWAARLSRQLLATVEGMEAHCLIACSAALRALDTYHRERRIEVERQVVDRIAFLAPAASPIAEQVPKDHRLDRSRSDLEHDLDSVLDLWWKVVDLEGFKVQPSFLCLPALVSEELGRRFERRKDLRIALASPFANLAFEASGDPSRRHSDDGTPYRFIGLAPASMEAARKTLGEIVAACAEEEVDVLCFPELSLDTDLLAHLHLLLESSNSTLHPALVVAGSFHVSEATGWVNRCRAFDGFGRKLFEQDKCLPYRLPATQASELPEELRALLGIDARGGFEDIQLSSTLFVIDSSVGRLATPICLDFSGQELRDLFVRTGTNLLFVPAMTPRLHDFQARARDLGTQTRATTFVANSSWLLKRMELGPLVNRVLSYVPAKCAPQDTGRWLSEELVLFSIREMLGVA